MIFLLGGRGFYGSAIARQLAARGVPHRVITRENYADFRGRSCDVLINANGNSSKLLARRAPLEDFDASVRSVRASLVEFPFQQYVYLSSVDVYPDCRPDAPTDEDAPLVPAAQSAYGFHKALAEQCVRHAAPRWLIVRLGGAVGPGLRKNAIFDILRGGPLWLDPESRLQFLRTDDAARTILDLLDAVPTNEVFNLCGAGTVALQEVMDAAERQVAVEPGAPRVHYEVSLRKLERILNIPATRDAVLTFIQEHSRSDQSQLESCPVSS